MSSLSEVRKVLNAMSAAVEHDIRKLIAQLNTGRDNVRARIIAPGARAETCSSPHDSQKPISAADSVRPEA
jgi:hypothetical protein